MAAEMETTRTPQEKKEQLFRQQKELLATFLAHGAITREQYNTSLVGLSTKMGLPPAEED